MEQGQQRGPERPLAAADLWFFFCKSERFAGRTGHPFPPEIALSVLEHVSALMSASLGFTLSDLQDQQCRFHRRFARSLFVNLVFHSLKRKLVETVGYCSVTRKNS